MANSTKPVAHAGADTAVGRHSAQTTTQMKTEPPVAPDPYPPYRRIYALVFQAWLIMAIGVICCSLIFYLLSYVPAR